MSDIKRACVYTRVSTEAQAEKETSLEEQDRMAQAAIVSKGWLYTKTYEDAGFSGRSMDRPALQQLMSDVKAGLVDAVVIFKLDRLSRRQRDAMTIIEDVLLANNVELISLHETLDTSTPWGRAMIGILASFNQLECENITLRTSTCRNAKAREGKYAGGCPPLGYKAVNGELVVDEPMANIVRMIFAKRNAGATLAGISSFLNDEGYKTRKGKQFYPSTIREVLKNESFYRGQYDYGCHSKLWDGVSGVQGAHEALLKDGV